MHLLNWYSALQTSNIKKQSTLLFKMKYTHTHTHKDFIVRTIICLPGQEDKNTRHFNSQNLSEVGTQKPYNNRKSYHFAEGGSNKKWSPPPCRLYTSIIIFFTIIIIHQKVINQSIYLLLEPQKLSKNFNVTKPLLRVFINYTGITCKTSQLNSNIRCGESSILLFIKS